MVALDATLAQVRHEARRIDVAKVLLTLLLAVPFALGWSARMTVRGLAWACSFAAAAAKVGWQAGAAKPTGGG